MSHGRAPHHGSFSRGAKPWIWGLWGPPGWVIPVLRPHRGAPAVPARAELSLSPPEHSRYARDSSRVAHAAGITLPTPHGHTRDGNGTHESPVVQGRGFGSPGSPFPPIGPT